MVYLNAAPPLPPFAFLSPPRSRVPVMPSTPRALVLIAAEMEATILRGAAAALPDALEICVAGVGTGGDARAIAAINETAAEIVVNPGFAGGLVDTAVPGDLFTVTQWHGLEVHALTGAATEHLAGCLAPLAPQAAIAVTVEQPAGDAATRERLAATGATLVEMEGARWAAAAHHRGLPFVSIRVVSDDADNALPLPRHKLLTAQGDVRWGRWLRALAQGDDAWRGQYRALRRAQRDWIRALETLAAVGAALRGWEIPRPS